MIKPGEIQALASRQGVKDTQIEKDYILSWVLLGIEKVLSKRNVLKRQWETSLAHQMHNLPKFEGVWRDLGKHLRRFNKFVHGSRAEEEKFEYGFLERGSLGFPHPCEVKQFMLPYLLKTLPPLTSPKIHSLSKGES
jgi:hypothetical protein